MKNCLCNTTFYRDLIEGRKLHSPRNQSLLLNPVLKGELPILRDSIDIPESARTMHISEVESPVRLLIGKSGDHLKVGFLSTVLREIKPAAQLRFYSICDTIISNYWYTDLRNNGPLASEGSLLEIDLCTDPKPVIPISVSGRKRKADFMVPLTG